MYRAPCGAHMNVAKWIKCKALKLCLECASGCLRKAFYNQCSHTRCFSPAISQTGRMSTANPAKERPSGRYTTASKIMLFVDSVYIVAQRIFISNLTDGKHGYSQPSQREAEWEVRRYVAYELIQQKKSCFHTNKRTDVE
jgi:hypothetical protein